MRRELEAAAVAAVLAATCLGCEDGAQPAGRPTSSTLAAGPSSGPKQEPPATRDEALRRQLQRDPAVVLEMTGTADPEGVVLCGIRVLGSDTDQTHLYTWLGCGSFTTGTDAKPGASTGEAALLTVTGRGADVHLVDVRFPRQERINADLDEMFPPDVARIAQAGNIQVSPDWDALLAEARNLG